METQSPLSPFTQNAFLSRVLLNVVAELSDHPGLAPSWPLDYALQGLACGLPLKNTSQGVEWHRFFLVGTAAARRSPPINVII